MVANTESRETNDIRRALFDAKRASRSSDEFFKRLRPMIARQCRRHLYHHADVEDATQLVFLTFYRKAYSIRNPQAIDAWLRRTATNISRRIARGLRRRAAIKYEQSSRATSNPGNRWDARDEVSSVINAMPERYGQVLRLRYGNGMKIREIAELLDAPASTVSMRLTRGKEYLRQRLRSGCRSVDYGI